MLSKIFNKDYPEFWKKYTDSFKKPASKYVVISLETSGIDPEKDVIMAIAATSVIDNRIIIKDAFEITIQHKNKVDFEIDTEIAILENVDEVSENQAIERLLNYLGNSILIGHRIDFDIEILNEVLSRMKLGKIRNEAFDIEAMFNKVLETNEKKYALDEMNTYFKISGNTRNSVANDAFAIALLFLKLKNRLSIT